MTELSFSDLGVAEPILRALKTRNHTVPTPIQAKAIPDLLEGHDLLGIAQTGTGKTGAFAMPILQRLSAHRGGKTPRALVLAPTRELAIQIAEDFGAYGAHLKLRHTVIYGGVRQGPQVKALARGVDVVIATPGRLLDLMGQRCIDLRNIEVLVLDEADRMLDMGFVRDVRKIVAALPKARQSLLFSATMPQEIGKLSAEMLDDPIRVEVTPQATTVERIVQRVYHVDTKAKGALLAQVLDDEALSRVIVFSRTKHGADRVARRLDDAGVRAAAIHGNKSQNARQKALGQFRNGEVRVLVATDIAARGIDVDDVSHVINYDLPHEPESYVHRIGRTARAGKVGIALSFCDGGERADLRAIERLTKVALTVVGDAPTGDAPSRDQKPPRGGKKNNTRRIQRARTDNSARPQAKRRPKRARKRRGGGGASAVSAPTQRGDFAVPAFLMSDG